jgi:hypothetical protein
VGPGEARTGAKPALSMERSKSGPADHHGAAADAPAPHLVFSHWVVLVYSLPRFCNHGVCKPYTNAASGVATIK